MNWEEANKLCTEKEARLLSLKSRKEKADIIKANKELVPHPIMIKFWLEKQNGKCYRSEFNSKIKMRQADCKKNGNNGGPIFFPLCKKDFGN